MSGEELALVNEAFASNWIAPLGPHVDAFEKEFAVSVGARYAVAVSSGTAALHLALICNGIGPDHDVLVSSMTFSASVYPIRYVGAVPVFIDSELTSWNLDPNLVEEALRRRTNRKLAVVPVHLYGQSADTDAIRGLCDRYGALCIEDAAEALGASYRMRHPGVDGHAGVFSFNGNKIITTSGGGMLVTADENLSVNARKIAAQARDDAPHYQHSEIGYNYRLSNVLAAIGRAQLKVLPNRVAARRRNFEKYVAAIGDIPGITLQPEARWGTHTRWLTCILIDPALFGADRERVRLALQANDIESRPLWKPMHMQPVFQGFEAVGGAVCEQLFEQGLCLPSGSNLSDEEHERVCRVIRAFKGGAFAHEWSP